MLSVEADFAQTRGTGTVGIDLGLNSLIAPSDGETVARPRFARLAQKAQRRRQRALARCRRDHLHKPSRSLVSRYQGIAFGDLTMAGLTKGRLARPVHDAAWSLLVQPVRYQAESAGAEVVLVDSRGTSQTYPACGAIKARMFATRVHACACGCALDRDVAAARGVHQRAFGSGRDIGLRRSSRRVAA